MDFHARTRTISLALLLTGAASVVAVARADDTATNIEQALAAARQSQRGITLYVNGQTVAGAVVRVDTGTAPGSVELRNQQYGRIVVRIDRIDAVAQP